MILLELPAGAQPLSPACLQLLDDWQKEINKAPSYSVFIQTAAEKWRECSRKEAFGEVKAWLGAMCSGARRCSYCEDSMADEVEHIQPKNWYPELTFLPNNYLYACGPCNGPKRDKWAVFVKHDDKQEMLRLIRVRGAEPAPPPAGKSVLVNPRIEDPFSWLRLNLRPVNEGLYFEDRLPLDTVEDTQRRDYTLEILRLNARPDLCNARWIAYENYKSRLARYVLRMQEGASADKLDRISQAIRTEAHPTVWREIQRHRREGLLNDVDEELDRYFDEVPEAVNW